MINKFMITYTLTINYMNTELVEGELTNVVSGVSWAMSAQDDSTPPNSFSVNRTTSFGAPDPENFVPYNELTEDIVKSWIYSTTEYMNTQVFLMNKIYQLQQSNTKVLPLPWS